VKKLDSFPWIGIRHGDSTCTPNVFVGWSVISNKLSDKWKESSKAQRRALLKLQESVTVSGSTNVNKPPQINPRLY
jgi:hypothetical protein